MRIVGGTVVAYKASPLPVYLSIVFSEIYILKGIKFKFSVCEKAARIGTSVGLI